MNDPLRLSLCMIVRDSARTLGQCLESISPWVDEMVVVDTGSTDNTREIAGSFGAKLFEFPWCDDFSAARNESLRHATGDWLLWIDSDDTISPENGQKLRDLICGTDKSSAVAYVMQVHCPGSRCDEDITVVDHVKLFRNDPQIRFEGRIHEQVLPALRAQNTDIVWTDIFVTHSGSDRTPEGRRRKQQRDLRLLELELAERPEHPFVLFNLGMTYADMEEDLKAAEFLKQCLRVSTLEESHVRKAYALLISCLVRLDKDEEALRIIGRARELFPDDSELLFRQGILYQRARRHSEAIEAYRGAIEDREERHFASRDRGITGYKARHNLATVYRETCRPDLAELQWRLALGELPLYKQAWRGLTEALIDQQRYTTLEVEIEQMKTCLGLEIEAACSSILRLSAIAKYELAKEELEIALAAWPADVELIRFGCEFLFNRGSAEECLRLLETLCELEPEDAAAWHNLGTTHQRAGRVKQAITCFEQSLTLRPESAATLLQLGFVLQSLGKLETAKATWEKALVLEPGNAAIRQVLKEMNYTQSPSDCKVVESL